QGPSQVARLCGGRHARGSQGSVAPRRAAHRRRSGAPGGVSGQAIELEATADDASKRASGSSFYLAMRILPPAQRQAMFEIYSFCRAVDDIADDPGEREARLAQLAQWRRDVDALYGDCPPPPRRGLAEATRRFGLGREDFLPVIDGMGMGGLADIWALDLVTLGLHCLPVGGAVGRTADLAFYPY